MLQKDPLARHVQHLARRARHQIEPVGVLRRRAIVRPSELGEVQRVFVAIDHQRHIGHIALVQPVAGDAALRRPAAKVACAVPQSIGKLFGLPLRTGQQTRRTRGRLPALSVMAKLPTELASVISTARDRLLQSSNSVSTRVVANSAVGRSQVIVGFASDRGGRGPWN